MVFKQRLKDLKDYDVVKIYVYELNKLGVNHGPLLWNLKERGELWYDNKGNFKALRKGPIDPKLLERTKRDKIKIKLTELHLYMRSMLMEVSLDVPVKDMPVYFRAFLEHRRDNLSAFFTVDSFSNRVHTPVVNLKGDLRGKIKFCGEAVTSLDVKQMQPTILAKVLEQSVGKNAFSDSIFQGEDVYELLLKKNSALSKRSEAKTFLFQLIFGKPMDDIASLFEGDSNWVRWINEYKSKLEPKNPHKANMHTNLAWLLQFSEVQVMSAIWQRLMDDHIMFLTVHDDILCKKSDKRRVEEIMDDVLKDHFKSYTIVVKDY